MESRRDLRRRLRMARRALSGWHRRRAEWVITHRILRLPAYRKARCVAVYLAFDGEVDLSVLVGRANAAGKIVCLPVIDSSGGFEMSFTPLFPGDRVKSNRLGIGEPARIRGRRLLLSAIDLVVMPVVGFDESGTRLGMGGGFYDRCFSHLAARPCFRRRLIGAAFDCQKVSIVERQMWDVPLATIVTEKKVYRSSRMRPQKFCSEEDVN